MNEYTLWLIIIGVGATFVLTAVYIWHAFFWRSWGKVIGLVSRLFVDSTDIIDVNKKIEPDMSASRSDIIKAQAATVEAMPISVRPLEPQKAHIPEQEQSQYERTTSESGWPRVLSEEERQDPRPFRHVHIATENEALAEETSETDNPPSNKE